MTVLVDVPLLLVAIMTGLATTLALRAALVWYVYQAALPAGLLAAVTMWMTPGTWSAVLVAPYALVCAAAGVAGVLGIVRAPWPPAELAKHAGTIVLAGAAVWLVAYRAGHPLLGYPPLWVLLTAAHFHIAGCYLPIVIGSVAKDTFAQAAALGCVLGFPLTAIGIEVGGALETLGALVMALSALAVAIVLARTPRWQLRIAGVLLAAGMALAVLYALRAHGTAITLGTLDPLSSMIVSHAVLNTLFALLALRDLNAQIGIHARRTAK